MSEIPRLPALEPGNPRQVKTSVNIDADVLKWYKAGGRGLQTRINFALRWFMEEYKRQHGDPARDERKKP